MAGSDDIFQAYLRSQQANANGAGGGDPNEIRLLDKLLGKPPKGTLEALSTNGFITREVDMFGLNRETWLSKIIKGGFSGAGGRSGGGSEASEISAPPVYASSARSSSSGDGFELG
jgi:hypothetical protein